MALVTKHTQALIIAQVHELGQWHGRRRGVVMTFTRERQITLNGDCIKWHAFRSGRFRRRGDQTPMRTSGSAGTVAEAIAQIEEKMRSLEL